MNRIFTLLLLVVSVYSIEAKSIFYKFSDGDIKKLEDFYNQTEGDLWLDNHGWTSLNKEFTETPEIRGVTVSNTDEVLYEDDEKIVYRQKMIGLDLFLNTLQGELDEVDFQELEKLEINYNMISGNIQKINCPIASEVDISNNKFTGELPEIKADKATTVFLSLNKFSENDPEINLPMVDNLSLNENEMQGVLYLNTPMLTQLGIHVNKFHTIVPTVVNDNPLTINLRNNKFTFHGLEQVVEKFNIKELFYSDQDTIIPIDKGNSSLAIMDQSLNNTYQWFNNGEKVEGAVHRVLNIPHDGQFYCEIKNSIFPNLTLKSETVIITDVHSSNTNDELNIKINSNNISFSFDNEGFDVSASIIDINGNQIQNFELPSFVGKQTEIVSINHLISGVYFIHLKVGNKHLSEKFVVSK